MLLPMKTDNIILLLCAINVLLATALLSCGIPLPSWYMAGAFLLFVALGWSHGNKLRQR